MFLALLLWFHATTDQTYEYTFRYPLKITNLPENLILAEEVPSFAQVQIQGKGKQLIKFFFTKKNEIKIDGSDFKAKQIKYQLSTDQIKLPKEDGLVIKDILSPQNLDLKIDYLVKKKVEVIPQYEVTVDPDYIQKEEVRMDPIEVTISGPRRFVKLINSVSTEKKVFSNIKESIEEKLPLSPPEYYNVKYSPEAVTLWVNVERGAKKEFENLILDLTGIPKGRKVQVEPEKINLTLLGEENVIGSLNTEQIKATLDLKGVEGKRKLVPKISVPEEVKLLSFSPDSFEVEVK
ncbi:MAG: hypothetical protein AMJ90_01795 [candidate division Zixibacteria bacterium SM23_73_2]|nr:MAG: hypothetical protein AMJ90_01795 [candidate division Zixibacteria bacterium SM23_73_2]